MKLGAAALPLWASLESIEKWCLIADGVRPSTVTLKDVTRIRRALRSVFKPGKKALS